MMELLALRHPPRVTIRVGPPVEGLTGESLDVDTKAIMAAIVDLLPPEARQVRTPTRDELARTYAAYQDLTARAGVIDFGDQIVLALRVLRERPHVLARYRRRFRYLLVDEFEDTNHAQFELVKLLAGRDRNVTVVGDDDQAIFRFRGASMSNILDFGATYPDTRRVVLIENYRSGQRLLDAAHRLIRHNDPERLEAAQGIDKRLRAAAGEGPEPIHRHFDRVTDEAVVEAAA